MRQKVVDSGIHATQMYNYAPIMEILWHGVVVSLELKARVLDKSFLGIVVIEKDLERLLLFCKSNWKVIDLVV